MAFGKNTIFLIFSILVTLSSTVLASGSGACVRRPDPTGPDAADLITMRIASGKGIAQSYSELWDHPGMYYFDALRECHPRKFVALYDSQGNAHIRFVIKDKKMRGFPLKGPNLNICNLKAIIG